MAGVTRAEVEALLGEQNAKLQEAALRIEAMESRVQELAEVIKTTRMASTKKLTNR